MEIANFPESTRPMTPPSEQSLRDAAMQLEASFLAEMLRAAKLGQTSEDFGGGIGEEQFSSLLVDAYAEKIAERGGIGLAEQLFNSLKDRSNS